MAGILEKIRKKFMREGVEPRTILDDDELNEITRKMENVIRECVEERNEFYKDTDTWHAWALGDRKNMQLKKYGIIPTSEGDNVTVKDWQSVYHLPVVTQFLRTLVGILSSEELQIKYSPMVDNKTLTSMFMELYGQEFPPYDVDNIARQGNVYFQRLREHARWRDRFHEAWMEMGIFDHTFMRMIVERVSCFPDASVNIQKLNVWQMYHTAGRELEDATEVVAIYTQEPEELKANYPEFSDEIDALIPTGMPEKASPDAGQKRIDSSPGATKIWATKPPPSYGGTKLQTSTTAISVKEFWQLDTSIDTYSKEACHADLDKEHDILNRHISNPTAYPISEIPPDLEFKIKQYHKDHIAGHEAMINEWNKLKLNNEASYARAESIALLQNHIDRKHMPALRDVEPGKEGRYVKYPGGWRQTIMLGDNEELVVYDGPSQYLDYGRSGHPFIEYNMMGWAMHYYGPSFVALLVDINRIKDGAINSILDNMKWSGNNKLEMEEDIKDKAQVNNDPSIPNIYPPETFAMQKARWVPGLPANPTGPALLELMDQQAAMTAGIFNTVRGFSDRGVRSGTQVQALANYNMTGLSDITRRIKTPVKKLAMDLLKASFKIAPPDDFLLPSSADEVSRIDYKILSSLDFTIEVNLVEGAANLRQEQLKFLQIFMQNFGQQLSQRPSGFEFMLALMDPLVIQEGPPELQEIVQRLKAELMAEKQMQQQQQAQAQQMQGQQGMRPNQPGLPMMRPGMGAPPGAPPFMS